MSTKANLYHVSINISNPSVSIPFYKDFLRYLGYKIIKEGDDYIGFTNGINDFWFVGTENTYIKSGFDRHNTGLNHLAFMVESKEKVDQFHKEFLLKNKMATLYDSPRLFPEYTADYYAVFFEDPDKIKLEVVYRSSDKREINHRNYDDWSLDKTILHNDKVRPFFHEGEIWSGAVGLNIGFEQDGKGKSFLRPMLIIKKFNNEVFWGLPLTTRQKKGKYYFSFNMNDSVSVAILSQIRLMDAKRLYYKIGNISKEDFNLIRKHLTQLLA